MLNRPLHSLFWNLPHETRRLLYRIARPNRYRALLQALIDPQPANDLAVFRRRRQVFVHIPKTAGRSIGQTLFGGISGGHRRLRDYALLFPLREWQTFFTFSFVRNPWDRAFSAWQYVKRGGEGPLDTALRDAVIQPMETFENFVLRWMTPARIARQHLFCPQTHFLVLKGNRPCVDFIGFTENIEVDFPRLCTLLSVDGNLPRLNCAPPSSRLLHGSVFTPEITRRLSELYAEDLRHFPYPGPGQSPAR